MEESMGKTKTLLYAICLASAVSSFVLVPSLVQSQGGTATLTVEDDSGVPGSQGNQITVSLTTDVSVGGMQLDICDEGDFMVCAGCQGVDRGSAFLCDTNEQSDGCCGVLFVDVAGGGLAEGAGPVITVNYNLSANAPGGECRELSPENIVVRQDNQEKDLVDTLSVSGDFCFSPSTTTTSRPCPSKEIYGENSQETQLLRSIRDTILSQTPEGRTIITLYYQWSPAIVKAMQQDKALAADMRKMLDELLMLIP